MFGTPITYCPVVSIGASGKIVSVKMNDMFAEDIKSLQLIETIGETSVEANKLALTELMNLPSNVSAPDGAFTLSSGTLYIFINTSTYDYLSTTLFFLIGTRVGLPITSFESQVDVPEKDLELFIKYVIKEAAELQGRIVPPAIELDIKTLEAQVKEV